MGCGGSTPSAESLVSDAPLPKGHPLLAELAFLSEVVTGKRVSSDPCPEHLGWIMVLGDGAITKWIKEVVGTSTKRKQLEEAGTTVEAFEAWATDLGAAIEKADISPFALQISWEVGQHAGVAHGDLARF